MPVELKRGVNVGSWLRSSEAPEKNLYHFKDSDAELVAKLGFDHLRLNAHHGHLWDKDDKPIQSSFDMIDHLLETCSRLGLKALFTMHQCPFFRERDGQVHFHEPEALPAFLKTWVRLSKHMSHWSTDMLVYEFFNEPTAEDPEVWNRLSDAVHVMLRELEPDRTLMLGSNGYSGPGSFPQLRPREDRNLILTFHFYLPFQLTHYRVGEHNAQYKGPVHYPGQTIADEDLATMTEEQRRLTLLDNGPYDPEHLREKMIPAIDFARKLDMPLYCGEWGVYDSVPRADSLRWHSDMATVLESEGIGWGGFAYRAHWGFVLDIENKLDKAMVAAVIQ